MPRYHIPNRAALGPDLKILTDEQMDALVDSLIAEGRLAIDDMGHLYPPRDTKNEIMVLLADLGAQIGLH